MRRFISIILSVLAIFILVATGGSSLNASAEVIITSLAGTVWESQTTADTITFVDEHTVHMPSGRNSVTEGSYYVEDNTVVLGFSTSNGYKEISGTIEDDKISFPALGAGYTFVLKSPVEVLESLKTAANNLDVDALWNIFDQEDQDIKELRFSLQVVDFAYSLLEILDTKELLDNINQLDVTEKLFSDLFYSDLLISSHFAMNLWYSIHEVRVNGDEAEIVASLYWSNCDRPIMIQNPVLIKTVLQKSEWRISNITAYDGELLDSIKDVDHMMGTWNLSSVWSGNAEMTMEFIQKYYGNITIQLQLSSDGTYTTKTAMGDEVESQAGTWENHDGTVYLGADNVMAFFCADQLMILYEEMIFSFSCADVQDTNAYVGTWKQVKWSPTSMYMPDPDMIVTINEDGSVDVTSSGSTDIAAFQWEIIDDTAYFIKGARRAPLSVEDGMLVLYQSGLTQYFLPINPVDQETTSSDTSKGPDNAIENIASTSWLNNEEGARLVFLPDETFNMEMIDYQITINMPYSWENGTLTLYIDKDVYVYGVNDYTETQLAEPMEIACEIRGDTLYMVYDEYTVPFEYEGQIGEKNIALALQEKQEREQQKVARDFVWEILSDNTISITQYIGNETAVVIPEKIEGRTVTSIGAGLFADNHTICSVTLPEGLLYIEDYAFGRCTSLTSLTIPEGVKSIGESAFQGCTSLTNIAIPNEVTSIGDLAFESCTSLTSIAIPGCVKEIGYGTFINCHSLTNVVLPKGLERISGSMFFGCYSLVNLTIPESVTSIEMNAFKYCRNLTSLTLPAGITSIGDSAFANCYNLSDLLIPNGVTNIHGFAFSGCSSLTNLTLPEGIATIGPGAFYDCSALTTLIIPDSVTSIESRAFDNCSELTLVVGEASYGEQYAKDNNLNYTYMESSIAEQESSSVENTVEEAGLHISMQETVALPDMGEVTVTDYLVWENLRKYNAGKHKVDPSSSNITVYHSGDSSRHAFIQVDIVNTTGNAINYLSDCTVYAVTADGTVHEGWAHQYNWNNKTSNNSWGVWNGVQNKKFFIDEKDEFEIIPNETGHFCFGATLPRELLKGSDTLQLIIQMGETQIIYSIIP